MKRKFLEDLGLDKEQIDSVMAENGKDIEAEKEKAATTTTELEDIKVQLKEANSTITDLKKNNGDNEALQKTIKDHEVTIKTLETNAANTKKEYALKEKLKDLGVTDCEYLIYKHGGVDKFNFDKEGNLIGLEDTINPYKESIPHIFKQQEEGKPKFSGVNPVDGTVSKTKVDTSKMTYAELCKYIEENPNAQI